MESDRGLIFTSVHALFRKTRFHPRITSGGRLFPDHALMSTTFPARHDFLLAQAGKNAAVTSSDGRRATVFGRGILSLQALPPFLK